MEKDVHPNLAMIQAAMMEELGIGRKDTLPLEDRGYRDGGCLPSLPARRPVASDNPWQSVVFDDVDEAELALDSIGDGQLYRIRRGQLGNSTGRGGLSRGGGAVGRSYRGGRGGHAPLPDRAAASFMGHHPVLDGTKSSRGARGNHSTSQSPAASYARASLSASGSLPSTSRQVAKNRIDATIARLREPSKPAATRPLRKAVTSTYLNLISGDEFFAQAGIGQSPKESPISVHSITESLNALEISPTSPRIRDGAGKEGQVAQPTPENKAPPATLPKQESSAATLVSNNPPNTIPSVPESVISEPVSTIETASFGQLKKGGLAGSRWANPQPSQSRVIADGAAISTAGELPQATAPTLTLDSSSEGVLFGLKSIMVSHASLPRTQGSLRLVTGHGRASATLEIIVDGVPVMREALYKPDTFVLQGPRITFQPHPPETAGSLTWKLDFPLPYQARHLLDIINRRLKDEPQPLQKEQPLVDASVQPPASQLLDLSTPSGNEASDVPLSAAETTVTAQTPFQEAESPPAEPNNLSSQNSQLLIDLDDDKVAQPSQPYVSQSTQSLMGLMAGDIYIDVLLVHFDKLTGGSLLDYVYSICGHSQPEEYSPEVASVIGSLVTELYRQTRAYYLLDNDGGKALTNETSQKIFEKALEARRAQATKDEESPELENCGSISSGHQRIVYSTEELVGLRSSATAAERQLVLNKEEDLKAIKCTIADSTALPAVKPQDPTKVENQIVSPRPELDNQTVRLDSIVSISDPAREEAGVPDGPQHRSHSAVEIQELSHENWSFTKAAATLSDDQPSVESQHDAQTRLSTTEIHTVKIEPATLVNSEAVLGGHQYQENQARSVLQTEPVIQPQGQTKLCNTIQSNVSDLTSKTEERPNPGPQHLKSTPSEVSQSVVKNGQGNPSTGQLSDKAKQSSPMLEINNGNLQGNPGLAASRWATPVNQPTGKTGSFLNRNASTRRTTKNHQTQNSQPNFPWIGPTQYPTPQVGTVLVPDPITGVMIPVTGIVDSSGAAAGGFATYSGPSFPNRPNMYEHHSLDVSGQETKPDPEAPTFRPAHAGGFPLGPSDRPALTTTRRENAQIQGPSITGSPYRG